MNVFVWIIHTGVFVFSSTYLLTRISCLDAHNMAIHLLSKFLFILDLFSFLEILHKKIFQIIEEMLSITERYSTFHFYQSHFQTFLILLFSLNVYFFSFFNVVDIKSNSILDFAFHRFWQYISFIVEKKKWRANCILIEIMMMITIICSKWNCFLFLM